MESHDRRKFIRNVGMVAIAVSAFGCASFAKDEDRFVGDCSTTDDILGPFYRPGAPVRKDMTYEGQKGTQVKVMGKVYTDDCTTVLKDVKVEIWLADDSGAYDNNSDKFLNRAQWKTGNDGAYAFTGILPGRYMNGNQYRPSHMHFRVSAEGHKELVSQIYFHGDPYIEKDPWASQKKAALRILKVEEKADLNEVTFDIYLEKAV